MSLICPVCDEERSYGRNLIFRCSYHHNSKPFGKLFSVKNYDYSWNCGEKIVRQSDSPIILLQEDHIMKTRHLYPLMFE
ncbi:MAG: hypothetical protein ACFFD7_14275 [Candidatus Thorarchaeota archaeon]